MKENEFKTHTVFRKRILSKSKFLVSPELINETIYMEEGSFEDHNSCEDHVYYIMMNNYLNGYLHLNIKEAKTVLHSLDYWNSCWGQFHHDDKFKPSRLARAGFSLTTRIRKEFGMES